MINTVLVNPQLYWKLAGRKNSGFPKTFFGGNLFAFVQYLRLQLQPQNENFKNYNSILVTVKHQNWLDALPLLKAIFIE